MLTRALIVLLLVLNLGVASWWALRAPPPATATAALPAGVPRLQLASEAPRHARPPVAAAPVATAVATATATPAAVEQCFAFGPFADAPALASARAALQLPQVRRLRVRETVADSAHGWRVWLPSAPDQAAAQATAARIAAAGFQDFYVMPGGDEPNSIALGRYGSEDAARRRQAALVAAGFAAQAQALGGSPAASWLDVATTGSFDGESVRARIHAPQLRPLDCAKLR